MRLRMLVPVIAVGAASVVCAAVPATASTPAVHLARIQYDAPGKDTTHNVNGEDVKITNSGHSSVSLKGWTLRDPKNHVFTFPSHTLRPGASVWVHTGKGRDSGATLYWGMGWHVWNNTGDTASLRDSHGKSVDSCTYHDSGVGYTNC
jgi:hypothetical protein